MIYSSLLSMVKSTQIFQEGHYKYPARLWVEISDTKNTEAHGNLWVLTYHDSLHWAVPKFSHLTCSISHIQILFNWPSQLQ